MEAEELELEKQRMAERSVKDARRIEREQRRRQQKLKRKFADDDEELGHKIAVEERKLLVAQRKLESIRLLDELLERIKVMRVMECLKMSSLWLAMTMMPEEAPSKGALPFEGCCIMVTANMRSSNRCIGTRGLSFGSSI